MLAPLQIRNFRMLFSAQVFSDFGTWLEFVALNILITYQWELGGGATAAYFIFVCLPYVLFGPFLGVWADLVDRRKVMILSDLMRMCLLIALIWVPNLYVLLLIVFLKGTLTTLFNSARQGTIRRLVPDEMLMQANSLSQTSVNLSKFIGPTLGGILLGVISMEQVYLLAAFCYLLSALFLTRLPALVSEKKADAERNSYLDELKYGLHYIPSNRTLSAVIVFFVIECLAMFAFEPQISQLTSEVEMTKQQYTYCVSLVGLGSMTGAYLLGRFGQRVDSFTLLLYGASVLGAALLAVAVSGFGYLPVMLPVWLPLFFFVGLGIGALGVCYGFLLQSETPPELMGRVSGTIEAVVYAGILAGAGIGGMLAHWFGASGVFLYAGVFFIVLGVGFKVVTASLRIAPSRALQA